MFCINVVIIRISWIKNGHVLKCTVYGKLEMCELMNQLQNIFCAVSYLLYNMIVWRKFLYRKQGNGLNIVHIPPEPHLDKNEIQMLNLIIHL